MRLFDERFATEVTLVRLYSKVYTLVLPQVAALFVTFATQVTFVWFQASVYDLVLPQLSLLTVELQAHVALVRLFSSMNPVMYF